MICAGIDAGSRTIKAAIMDSVNREVLATGIRDQGIGQEALAKGLFEDVLEQSQMEAGHVSAIVATGYGRRIVSFADETVTEITCHARGVRHLVPQARTIIDIGGQDSKVIHVDEDGTVRDFSMNDRCAAGSGRFLEMVANRLEVSLPELGQLAARCTSPAPISSMCVVFAETEIVGLLASGTPPEDIVAGVLISIAQRVGAMAGRQANLPIILTGGGAAIPGMTAALQQAIGQPITPAPHPQLTGALGAAILACQRAATADTGA